ncbi:MAG: NHLP bacteriocin export ABC transporter permease/ATPase subunit [Lachnospiraceae bacterium]|nr:NHLP bacteriocin export ABC transporter permease/ATPase subunit [Lachnospiraceae bacterium]
MGWFDEQIRQRKDADLAAFEGSFQEIAEAVMGKRLSDALNDDRAVTTDAIGEILKYYHVKASEVPESIKDMNEVLEYLMRPYGIMRRTVKLEKGWHRDAVGAMLGTRADDGSVVALIPHGVAGYRFYDRKTGKYVNLRGKNENLVLDEAVAFYKPFPLKRMNIASFMKYLVEQIAPSDLAFLGGATAVATVVGMLMPKLNNMLFSDVLASGSGQALLGIAIFMICTTLSVLMVNIIQSLAMMRVNTKLGINVQAAAMMRLLTLPANFFRTYSSGEMSSRVSYISSLADQLVRMALSTGLTSIFSLAYVTQIYVYAPALVAPALVIILVNVVVSAVTMLLQVKISKQQMELSAKNDGMCHGLITGIQKIRLSGAEHRAFARWGKLYAKSAQLIYNPPMILKVSRVLGTAISVIGTMVLYYAAVKSKVSISEYYAFNTAYGMVFGAFMTLAGTATTIANIKPTLDMVRPILETVPEIDETKKMVTQLKGGIELNNVSFRYSEDMPMILDNLSLKIHPGQYVAIVGKTGCGKSTLMRTLLGFEMPQKGAVYYDGQDLKSLDPKSLRRRIGTVMQDGKLFMGDVYSNIVITAPWLTLDDAWEAAEIAGIAEDIRRMPMGMHTIISEGQGGISGGQRQRLMIARAVAPKPKILMFDEATSALDNLTQKQVSEALDKMKCTRIVIAHRLSTIRQCDRIIVLDGGRIIEDGTYEQLIAKNGYFAELVARQRLDVSEGA